MDEKGRPGGAGRRVGVERARKPGVSVPHKTGGAGSMRNGAPRRCVHGERSFGAETAGSLRRGRLARASKETNIRLFWPPVPRPATCRDGLFGRGGRYGRTVHHVGAVKRVFLDRKRRDLPVFRRREMSRYQICRPSTGHGPHPRPHQPRSGEPLGSRYWVEIGPRAKNAVGLRLWHDPPGTPPQP